MNLLKYLHRIHWETTKKENNNYLILVAQGTEQSLCCINRVKVTNGDNASNGHECFAADVLYMRINSHVMCKIESEFCAEVENDMTLSTNEREMQFIFYLHLFGRITRHSFFSSFNCNLFSIIQYLTSEMQVSTEEIAL